MLSCRVTIKIPKTQNRNIDTKASIKKRRLDSFLIKELKPSSSAKMRNLREMAARMS